MIRNVCQEKFLQVKIINNFGVFFFFFFFGSFSVQPGDLSEFWIFSVQTSQHGLRITDHDRSQGGSPPPPPKETIEIVQLTPEDVLL